jgi:hypothetical protein
MFRFLILQASHSLSDERTEYLIKDHHALSAAYPGRCRSRCEHNADLSKILEVLI